VGLNAAGIAAVLAAGESVTMFAGVGDGATAGDQTSAARVALTFDVVGVVLTAQGGPPVAEYTGDPGAGATHVLLFSAAAAGTFYGFDQLTGDTTFNAAGAYGLTSLTITGSSPT
jgi:hypothetical protein